jgi:hypothetical protein
MTDKEIFYESIKKAEENGFKTNWYKNGVWLKDEIYGDMFDHFSEFDFTIFSTSFAKAFFKEAKNGIKEFCNHCGYPINTKNEYCDHLKHSDTKDGLWRVHQHNMLNFIQKGKCPLQYLKTFL